MKFIQNVRVAIYANDLAAAKALTAALADFGMPAPVLALTVEDLVHHAARADVVVIQQPWTNRQHTASIPETVRRTTGREGDLPFLLIVDQADRPLVRLAAAAGYRAVVPAAHGARGIYRKIGAVLQNIRRVQNDSEQVGASDAA